MRNWRELLDNERGTVLALALIVLVIMTALAVGLAAMGGVESRISASQSAGSRARLLAEAGIAYALPSLAGVDFNRTLEAGPTLIPASTTLPGLTAASGTFGVTIRNDINESDALLTGVGARDAGTATLDTNGIVILTSTGTVDGATRVVLAVVQRGKLNVEAALSLPGAQADTTTDSPCATPDCPPNPLRNYSIDGRDWLRTDTATPTGTSPLRFGIATGSGMDSAVSSAFSDTYRRNFVQGKHSSTGLLTTGLNTIAALISPTAADIQKFVTNLAANLATQIIPSTQACQFSAPGGERSKPEGLHVTATASPSVVAITNNCAGSARINQTMSLGTPTSPQILYFKGEYDATSNFVGVTVDGTQPIQGYGLLVVEDADLAFAQTGKFRWDGIVLVTGRNVSVAFKGDSDTEIRGALVANEANATESGGYFELFNRTTNSMIVRASRQNIDMALQALYNLRITSYREVCGASAC